MMEAAIFVVTLLWTLTAWGYVVLRMANYGNEPSELAMLGIVSTPFIPLSLGILVHVLHARIVFA